jgi:hypothetical protein
VKVRVPKPDVIYPKEEDYVGTNLCVVVLRPYDELVEEVIRPVKDGFIRGALLAGVLVVLTVVVLMGVLYSRRLLPTDVLDETG